MKLLFTLMLFSSLAVYSQSYVATWTGWGHKSYSVQQSRDTINWKQIGSVTGNTNLTGVYHFNITATNYYYRVVADQDTTNSILVPSTLAITPDSVFRPQPDILPQKLEIVITLEGGEIHIKIESVRREEIGYCLYDITGRKLFEQSLNLKRGHNDIIVPGPALPGIYVARFVSYFEAVSKKIIITGN